jgi:hypothetical protein
VADETLYLTLQEIQDIRWQADHRDEPGVLYRGQRIVAYREWMEGDVYSGALWHGVLVLADGAWLELEKCGFTVVGEEHEDGVDGIILMLAAQPPNETA